ncbi:MAG TPA: SpoIIE family protein phosphatase [Solirubrobacteraceae bacterium]|nr:SpoIIE family protein phosphatase [Solirubrobacteraceae bacterium]
MTVPGSGSLAERVVRALAGAATAAEATQDVLRELARRYDAAMAVLWLLDERDGMLRSTADWAAGDDLREFRDVCRRLALPEGVGIVGGVLASGEPAVVEDISAEPHFPRAEAAASAGLRSTMAAPLLVPGGILGVVELLDREARAYDTADTAELEIVARQLGAYLNRLRTEDRLRVSEERSASIVAAALDCVITMDHRGLVTDFNPAAEATFGYTREQALGQVLAELIIPPELRDAHHRALATYVELGRATILNQRLELTGMRADGTAFPLELTVTRLGTSDPPHFAGFLRDITDRRRSEGEHDRLLREAVTSRALAEAAQQRSAAARAAAEQARSEAEAAGMRLALLAQAGEQMLATRDYEQTMQQVVELAVPAVADWCSITIGEPRGALRTVAVAHSDVGKMARAGELTRRFPPAPDAPVGAAAVIRSGRSELIDPIEEEHLRLAARDEEHLALLRELAPRAVLTVPLRSPRKVFGALTLAISESGRRFTPEDVAMAENLGTRAALAIENARLFSERSHIAETLQRSLLPTRLPSVPGVDLAARYRAAGEANLVGGDFYDVFRSGDGVWTAILGDVSGKGPEAAALTALTRHTLRAGALRESSPKANLRLLNEALLASRDELMSRFATVIYARVCRDPGGAGAVVTVSTGGHLPPLVVRANGELEAVDLRGTLLGAVEDVELDDLDVQLAPGDLMLLYTDGVTEVRPREPRYGERLLKRVLLEHADANAQELVRAVEDAAVAAQEGEPRDDIALIAIRAEPDGRK